MKKILFVFTIVLIIFVVLFTAKKPNSDNTIVFWTLQLSSFEKYINRIISDFEKENPNIKVKWIDVPYSEGEKRTLAAILSDNPPDLINLTPDFSLLLAQKNTLFTIDVKDMKSFIPSVVETLKYDDKYFGIPFYVTSAVTLCNEDLYKGEGPKSYDDLFSLVPPDGTYITMFSFSENDTLLKLLNKYQINSPQTVNSSKSVALFKTFKKLYDDGYIPEESVTQTHRDALEKYMSGRLMFLVTGTNFLNMIKENAPSIYKSTRILPQLTGDTGLYDYSLMNFIIPKKSKNPQMALKFALFLTSKENQLELAKMTTILPVNAEAIKDDYFKYYTLDDIQSQARVISANQLNNLQPPLKNLKNKKELNVLSSNYVQDILINNASVKNVLDSFALDWEKL